MNQRRYEPVIDDERLSIQKSEVHGYGVFANEYIPEGDEIGIWLTKENDCGLKLPNGFKETCDLGRFCNHSDSPNTDCHQILQPEKWLLTSKGIKAGEEIFVHYGWAEDITGFRSEVLD